MDQPVWELNSSHITVTPSSGAISSVTINGGGVLGSGYFDVRVDISGAGTGAEIEATLDVNGSINGFNVPVGGSGYTADTNLTIVPIIRAIGYGQTAEVVMDTVSEFNATTGENEFVSNSFRLATGFAGEPRGGSGYVVAPIFRSVNTEGNLVSWTQNGKSFNRLPLEETNGSSSKCGSVRTWTQWHTDDRPHCLRRLHSLPNCFQL